MLKAWDLPLHDLLQLSLSLLATFRGWTLPFSEAECHVRAASGAGIAVEADPLEGAKPAGVSRVFVRAEPHPLIKGACLVIVATSSGFVTAWELIDTR